MTILLILVPTLVVFIGFQFVKRQWPWLDSLDPLVKQLIIVAGTVGSSMLYVKLGLPVPEELRSMQLAAVVGLIQGLAALGVHGVKQAALPPADG